MSSLFKRIDDAALGTEVHVDASWRGCLCGGAVTTALQHAQEFLPRAYRLSILVGEDAGDLMEVGLVVDCPCGEQLGQGHRAERWMLAAFVEIVRAKIPRADFDQGCGSDLREFVE